MAEKNLTQTPQKESVTKPKTETQTNEPSLPGAEYLAASPAMSSLAAGEMPPIEPQKHAIAMNRVIGNQETTKRILRSGLRSSGMRTVVQKSSAVIQRDGEPGGTVNLPLGYGAVTQKIQARIAIDGIARDMQELLTEMGGQSPVENPLPALLAKQADLNGNVPIPQAQADELNTLCARVQVAHDLMIMQIRQGIQAGFGNLTTMPGTADVESQLMDALAKASHTAFSKGEGEDKIAPIKDALSKVKTYNKKCGEVADYARQAAEKVGMVTTVQALKTFKEVSGGVGTVVGKVLSVTEAASDIATVAGYNKQKAGSMSQAANQLRNGVTLAGRAITLFKGVPLMGAYWEHWVVPLTDACLQGLDKLTDIAEKIGLESILDEEPGPNGAPLIPPAQMSFFLGGQAMLDFMYGMVNGASPSMPGSVKKYFYDFHKQFNAGNEEKMPEEPSSLNPLPELFGDPELYAWVERNKDMIWGQLYGSLPHSLRR
jgi:hypothetical protein